MAAKSTKSTASKASKGSTGSILGADVQKKLFLKLISKIKKEFQLAGDKAVKSYGTDPTKKSTLEKFNEKIATDITKKFEKLKHTDTKKVQKEYKSLADKIIKDAIKQDKSIRGVTVKESKTSSKALATASKTSTASKDGGSIMATYEEAANKGQKHVDDFVKIVSKGLEKEILLEEIAKKC